MKTASDPNVALGVRSVLAHLPYRTNSYRYNFDASRCESLVSAELLFTFLLVLPNVSLH